MLYFTSATSKLECNSVVWNSITTTDANTLERIQEKFTAFSYNHFLPHVYYSYADTLRVFKIPYLT
jgi:hypothetical protein